MHFSGNSHNRRKTFRKATRENVRNGRWTLRVAGSQKNGFRLGVENGDKKVRLFGPAYPRQFDAVKTGLLKFGVKPVKVVGKNVEILAA